MWNENKYYIYILQPTVSDIGILRRQLPICALIMKLLIHSQLQWFHSVICNETDGCRFCFCEMKIDMIFYWLLHHHWAHLGPTGPRWAPCWPHESCYLGSITEFDFDVLIQYYLSIPLSLILRPIPSQFIFLFVICISRIELQLKAQLISYTHTKGTWSCYWWVTT